MKPVCLNCKYNNGEHKNGSIRNIYCNHPFYVRMVAIKEMTAWDTVKGINDTCEKHEYAIIRYTPETRIPFGMYKNAKDNRLIDLPFIYLRQLIKDAKLDPNLVRVIRNEILNEPEEKKLHYDLSKDKKEIRKEITGCTKIGFMNKRVANDTLRHIRNTAKTEKIPVRSYECKICGAWHLTSKEK